MGDTHSAHAVEGSLSLASIHFVGNPNPLVLRSLQKNARARWIRNFDLLIILPRDIDSHYSVRIHRDDAVVRIATKDIPGTIAQPFSGRKYRDLSAEVGCGPAVALKQYSALRTVWRWDLPDDPATAKIATGTQETPGDEQKSENSSSHEIAEGAGCPSFVILRVLSG